MRRDRLTFAMIVGIPIVQVMLFGFVINTDPKALPTAVVDYDRTRVHAQHRPRAREHRLLLRRRDAGERGCRGPTLLDRGDVQFAITYSRRSSRGN